MIHHYYIILHIIKIIFIFKSFTCTGGPDPIDPGRFKLASRNFVGLPIIMPLMATNWLLQVQVNSEVNTDLSQVLVENWSRSRSAHGKRKNNSIKKNLLGSADGPAAPAAGKVCRMAAPAQKFEIAGQWVTVFSLEAKSTRFQFGMNFNLRVLISTNSLIFNCFRCILQIERL